MRISIDTGESDGYAFVLDYKGKKIKIKGDVIFISQLGTFYISNRNNAEYEVKENKNPPEFGQAKELYALGYKEVDDCAGSAIMPCLFYFNAPNSKVLVVTTYTKESYGNIAIFISDWYLE